MAASADEDEPKGRCQLSNNMIKLVTLITLLVSDFDIVMTLVAMYTYQQAGGVFIYGMGVIGFFFLMYIAACVYAGMESTKFLIRFKDKVRMKEINGISSEDLADALEGKRIFWMGCAAARAPPLYASTPSSWCRGGALTAPPHVDALVCATVLFSRPQKSGRESSTR